RSTPVERRRRDGLSSDAGRRENRVLGGKPAGCEQANRTQLTGRKDRVPESVLVLELPRATSGREMWCQGFIAVVCHLTRAEGRPKEESLDHGDRKALEEIPFVGPPVFPHRVSRFIHFCSGGDREPDHRVRVPA